MRYETLVARFWLCLSRPQRPRSFWSAPRIATSGLVQRHSVFEWLCEHNRLKPERIRFVRLDSEQLRRVTGSPWIADFRCYTWPEVAILGADQKERGLWGREYGYGCLGFPRALVAVSHVIKDQSSEVENAASGCYASLAHARITCPLNKWTFFFLSYYVMLLRKASKLACNGSNLSKGRARNSI